MRRLWVPFALGLAVLTALAMSSPGARSSKAAVDLVDAAEQPGTGLARSLQQAGKVGLPCSQLVDTTTPEGKKRETCLDSTAA